MQTRILWYIILINIVAFVVFGVDKWRAQRQRYRVSERTLYTLAALGGVGGCLTAMQVFRHKTIKSSFQWKFAIIALGWVIVLVIVLNRI